jgi:hypothetical protein
MAPTQQHAALPTTESSSNAVPASMQQQQDEYTIDESVFKTIWRDVVTIGRNLRTVLIPINWKFSPSEQALRNWDLWGPLVRLQSSGRCC